MTAVYEKYFGGGDLSMGKARMTRDIEKHRLSGKALKDLIGDLEAEGMLTKKPFSAKPKECWNEEYLSELSVGFIADYFSRAYLEHFGEVADYVFRTKAPQRSGIKPGFVIGAILVAALAAALAYRLFSYNTNSSLPEAPRNESLQSMQNSQEQEDESKSVQNSQEQGDESK